MDVNFDWTALKDIGVVGLCVVIVIAGYKVFELFISQWKNSTDAMNKNTEAFTGLSNVLERSQEREMQFQEYVKDKLDASEEREKDTLKKVKEIHDIIK